MTNHGYLEEHQHFCKRHQKCNKKNWLRNLRDVGARSQEQRVRNAKCSSEWSKMMKQKFGLHYCFSKSHLSRVLRLEA